MTTRFSLTLQRLIVPFVTVLALSFSSCSVTQHSMRRIYFPTDRAGDASDAVALAEQIKLSEQLTSRLRIPLAVTDDNLELYSFAADWLGTPYRYGAHSRRGTDCSGFAYLLYQAVYNHDIGRSSAADLMQKSERVAREDLREGDLVFFNINNRRRGRASHVGVYLKDGKFVHASTRNGVIISSLSEGYYKRTYIGAGRIK